jgi:hypothetical protein
MLLPKETYLCSEDLKHTIALAQTFQQGPCRVFRNFIQKLRLVL